MDIKTLYRYIRDDGGTDVSLDRPDRPYTEEYRLISDSGMILVNGDVSAHCIDTKDINDWTEIPEPTDSSESAGVDGTPINMEECQNENAI